MAQQQPARRKTQPAETQVSIPDRLYFRIGDVAHLCSLPAYVLRFWETEFPQLKPNKGGTGQRLYRKRDVEIVLAIKHLLYEEGFTIAGARQQLTEKRRTSNALSSKNAEISAPTSSKTLGKSEHPGEPVAVAKASAFGKSIASKPRLNALRKEMQELLSILGPSASGSTTPTPQQFQTSKKGMAKKTGRANDEPTLF